MKKYEKIYNIYKRDIDNPSELLEGQFTLREFEYLKDCLWTFTEKIDGTSIRVIYENGEVSFKGRTDKAQIPKHLLEYLQKEFTPERFNNFKGINMCLYGEGYGYKINKGCKYFNGEKKVGFLLFDISLQLEYKTVPLGFEQIKEYAKILDIPLVPIIGIGALQMGIDIVKSGLKSQFGDFIAEGVVARPTIKILNEFGRLIKVKIKSRDFYKREE